MNFRKFNPREQPRFMLGLRMLAVILASVLGSGVDSQAASIAAMFARPLIIGASVSADARAMSPGKKLALRFTAPANVRTVAISGRPGRWVLRELQPDAFEDRTIVIGLDLFFWDSLSPVPLKSEYALSGLMNEVSSRGLPIVLGDIPALRPGLQWGRWALNQCIRQACAAYWNCYLMPLETIYQAVASSGLRTRYGFLALGDLIPDGLHLSEPASDYLANVMLSVIQRRAGDFQPFTSSH